MKNIFLYTLGITLLGMVGVGNAEAASVPDNWSQKFNCEKNCPRFKVLNAWDNAAVLDRETSLVWEQSPALDLYDWNEAQTYCNQLQISNRKGWRIPTLQELASLTDTSQPFDASTPTIPPGHPFSNVLAAGYWSATTSASDTDSAWGIGFFVANVYQQVKTNNVHVWCVRGGSGIEAQ